MRKAVVRTFIGLACLPTATKFNTREPVNSSAWAPGQYAYILEATNPEDLKGGPERVVLTTFAPLTWGTDLLNVGDAVLTRHSAGHKVLPSRKIIGVRTPEGAVFGEVPPGSLGHWELMDGVTPGEVQERLDLAEVRRVQAKAAVKAVKTA